MDVVFDACVAWKGGRREGRRYGCVVRVVCVVSSVCAVCDVGVWVCVWEEGSEGERERMEIVPPPIPALSTNQNMRRVSTSQEQQPGQDRVSTSACEM